MYELLTDWERHLRSLGRAAGTLTSYLQVLIAFTGWLEDQGVPPDAGNVELADIEDYLIEVRERTSPANARKHYASLKQFWRWLVKVEKELDVSPMAELSPPFAPEKPVPVIADYELTALLKTCEGREFDARRDTALIRMFLDTGVRVGEMAGLTVDGTDSLGRPTGLDWRYSVAHVVGKGSRARAVPFGNKTANALRAYLRRRGQHEHATSSALWIGRFGGLTESGIAQMVERRCRDAGVDVINPHRFRHTFAHNFKAAGGSEEDLMLLMGWETTEMARRYGKSAAAARAQEAYRRLSLGDRF